jgi:hypothetical protein
MTGLPGSTFSDSETVTVELYAKIGANADHSNEEPVQRRIGWDSKHNKIVSKDRWLHFRDFGNQRSDDFTSLSSTADAAFTMDDGCHTLVGEDVVVLNGNLEIASTGDFYLLTFFGSGLDLDTPNDGIQKIASDLPLGFHTFQMIYTASGTLVDWYVDGIFIKQTSSSTLYKVFNFITYLPKNQH